ncbi:hypothetical protein MNBD_GAMMA11-2624 [hydrothermal vent metagenome]|uniref:FIGfam010717 n=1 Tax=hydrothermal vent metagenome TaxID=652676 RepID=A0A3B0WT23_9ZZZZ
MKFKICSLLFIIGLMPGICLAGLFGYQENERSNLKLFPQWLSVLERAVKQRAVEESCESHRQDQCHIRNWMRFLRSIKHESRRKQIALVNLYANQQDYILDVDNYGVEDFWATPREFLSNHGDCEDYAITKMLSLKILGFDMRRVRLVVLQDTNLRIAHAVLAIDVQGGVQRGVKGEVVKNASVQKTRDTLIMDNQVDEVISHKYILHYVPVYAVNENKWWMFLPH